MIVAIQQLPFIVGVNPSIRSVYKLYAESFDKLRELPYIKNDKMQEQFSGTLKELANSHVHVISKLAKGLMNIINSRFRFLRVWKVHD